MMPFVDSLKDSSQATPEPLAAALLLAMPRNCWWESNSIQSTVGSPAAWGGRQVISDLRPPSSYQLRTCSHTSRMCLSSD